MTETIIDSNSSNEYGAIFVWSIKPFFIWTSLVTILSLIVSILLYHSITIISTLILPLIMGLILTAMQLYVKF